MTMVTFPRHPVAKVTMVTFLRHPVAERDNGDVSRRSSGKRPSATLATISARRSGAFAFREAAGPEIALPSQPRAGHDFALRPPGVPRLVRSPL